MALVKCSECGKDISDTSKKCPHCGYKKRKNISKKSIIIGLIIVLITIIAGITIAFFGKEKPLTELETIAVDCILNYQSMLKNPDSLQVHEIRWSENDLVDGMIFIYLDVSAQNGFGGLNRSIARFGVENQEIQYQGNDNDDDSSWAEFIAEAIKEGWQELEGNSNAIISVERVMSEVNSN